MADILIIDDDKGFCYTLLHIVESLGYKVTCVHTIQEGLKEASTGSFDVVYLDVMLPDGNGLDILPKIHGAPSKPEVIIITSRGDPDGAELAIKNGAWDYLQKPSSLKEILLPLIRVLQYREEKMIPKSLVALKRDGIVGHSPELGACLDLLALAAGSETNVLITGETGTGKELFALAIHENSQRSHSLFVVVDCTALPENLVESILFGYEKGAYTGADKAQAGLMKQADGGTLFLDEVGELPLSIQKAFLRSIQERRFRPIGGKQEVESNFRLVAATNRDLDEMVRRGQFRNDLLFRLRSFTIDLPRLRDRPQDIKDLAMFYTARLCQKYGMGIKGFSPEFFEALLAYEWPGNVRELFLTLERALAAAQQESILFPKHLPTQIRVVLARSSFGESSSSTEVPKEGLTPSKPSLLPLKAFRETLIAKAEKEYLEELISHTKGDLREACRLSGLGRSRLYGLLNKYGIS
jgi:two-component system, NtrC family, response regulator